MASPDLVMAGSYDYQLVALSVLIAVLASYAALDLAGRVTAARGATLSCQMFSLIKDFRAAATMIGRIRIATPWACARRCR